MKNQYVGDIGDYTKLGILRVIEQAGFSIGVNWYLTRDDQSVKDGRHIDYLKKTCDTPDSTLFDVLKEIVFSNQNRTVDALGKSKLLNYTKFFCETLELLGMRADWHQRALAALQTQDVIFLDPDNGFITQSSSARKKHNKYVTYDEAADYYNAGATVIIYNHRDRSPEIAYIERLRRVSDYISIPPQNILCHNASRYSFRDYLILMQTEHLPKMTKTIGEMLSTRWSKYLSCRNLIY